MFLFLLQPQAQAPGQVVIVRTAQGTQPNDYLMFAIFVTLCCCLPCGIVAIVKATEVRLQQGGENGQVWDASVWEMFVFRGKFCTYVCKNT